MLPTVHTARHKIVMKFFHLEDTTTTNMPLPEICTTFVVPDISHHSIQQLLLDQYQVTEEYCNATTALHNTILDQQQQQQQQSTTNYSVTDPINQTTITSNETDRGFHLRRSIDRHQLSLTNVQNHICRFEQLVLLVEEQKKQLVCSNDNDMLSSSSPSSSVVFIRLLNLSLLQDHLHRTRRILRTIYTMGEGTSYYSNGIATPTPPIQQNKIIIKLVALASLRASIQIVKESLPQ
jgi:hypothetical protein